MSVIYNKSKNTTIDAQMQHARNRNGAKMLEFYKNKNCLQIPFQIKLEPIKI